MGANPHASNGSLLAYPDLLGELDEIRERGGRTIVIDPRRTGTADRADEWLPVRPGTDAALLLAVVSGARRGGPHRPRRPRRVGCAASTRCCSRPARTRPRPWPDWCGIDADRIRGLARELAGRRAAGGLRPHRPVQPGVRHPRQLAGRGGQHPDRPTSRRGRRPVPPAGHRAHLLHRPPAGPAHDRALAHPGERGAPRSSARRRWRCMAEEIDTPGDGQIKALITIAGNPVLSAPDAGRLDAALPLLDAMISIDNYLNETTPARPRDPPGPVAARAAALRRGHLGLRPPRRGPLVTADLRCRRPAPRVGDLPAARSDPRRHAGRRGRRGDPRRRDVAGPGRPPRRRRHPGRELEAARTRPLRRPHLPHQHLRRPLRRAARAG